MQSQHVHVRSLAYSEQGRREWQEDQIVELDIGWTGFVAVMIDGHGGPETAHAVARTLRNEAPYFRMTLSLDESSQDIALFTLFSKLQHGTANFFSGAVLTLALIDKKFGKAIICQLGDTAALHIRNRAVIYRTPTHNARTNLKEREIVLANGARWQEHPGYLDNGALRIQPTRVLGNRLFPELIRAPEIIRRDILPNDTLALFSDGVITTDDDQYYALEADTIASFIPHAEDMTHDDVRRIVQTGMSIRNQVDNGSAIFLLIS